MTVNTKTTNVAQDLQAPIAKKIPHTMTIHDDTRIDNYYWMRDDNRADPEIIAHLNAENAYTDAVMAHTEALQQQLFEEIKGRIVKDDNSVPVKQGNYFYSSEVTGDNEYAISVRADDFNGTNKTVLLDINELAKNHEYYNVSSLSVSQDENLLAYGEDTVSRRIYTIKVKNLATGEYLADEITGTSGSIAWQNDNKAFYYIKKDPQTLLGYQVYRHQLGTNQADDTLIFEETDPSFYTSIGKSKDNELVYIWHSSTETSAVSIIDANDSNATATPFLEREEGLEYSISKLGQQFYVLTNYEAVNFRLMKVDADKLGDKTEWQDVIAPQEGVMLEDYELFDNFLVYQQRSNGLTHITVRQLDTNEERELRFNDEAFTAFFYGNKELNTNKLRLYYSSMTTPASHYDINLDNSEFALLKQAEVLGDFNADNYQSERLMIPARDGKLVPVSLVYRKDLFKKDGTNPLYQYGYGSYGSTIDPSFSSSRLSLLDRGFVYAIAHIRGSEMLGRPWYEDGKKLTKQNTFNDFIDVTKALVEQGYGAKDKIFAVGGSAGGLLMGAIANQAPELYCGIAAQVPFVDVVTTMLDESIPLTTNEYDEWGNPNQKEYYEYMLSYSPYDNVGEHAYPNMLVTTGLHDSQVQYFEPMKWVAKLREMKTDNNRLLFKTDMEAGHGGASGRFKALHEDALEYAFFIDLLNEKAAK
ncbi:S9 family peptidase [Photobacterium leiognathi]|uniref:S9 family peptidase n=1 Tax=Photobacterium leiognathi TaxID=553611 RepID=UPI003AF3B5BC